MVELQARGFRKLFSIVLVSFLPLIGPSLFSISPMASSKQDRQSALQLIAKAYDSSDLRADGNPPFAAKVEVRVYGAKGAQLGNHSLIWASKQKWREEDSFEGYHDLRIAEVDKQWHVSNLHFEPYLVFQANQAFSFVSRLRLLPDQEVKKVSQREVNGARAECVEIKPKAFYERELCFDPALGGRLVYEKDATWEASYHYGEYVQFGSKVFPRKMQVYQGDKLIVEEQVKELTTISNIDSALFMPPGEATAHTHVGCKEAQRAKLILAPSPSYPESARLQRKGGVVRLYGVIGLDGSVRGVTVVHSVDPALDAAAASAVSQWRYEPTTCSGIPVETIAPLEVRFQP